MWNSHLTKSSNIKYEWFFCACVCMYSNIVFIREMIGKHFHIFFWILHNKLNSCWLTLLINWTSLCYLVPNMLYYPIQGFFFKGQFLSLWKLICNPLISYILSQYMFCYLYSLLVVYQVDISSCKFSTPLH